MITREGTGRFPEHDKLKAHGHSVTTASKSNHKGKGKSQKDHTGGQRSWRGQLGRRGPLRNASEDDVSSMRLPHVMKLMQPAHRCQRW